MKKISSSEIKKILPRRTKASNKSEFGHALIVGSSKKYLGAGILSALASTKTGAGYTHLMSEILTYSLIKYPDFIFHELSDLELKKCHEFAIGFGPGFGADRSKIKFLKLLVKNNFKRVVLDADGLELLKLSKIKKLPPSFILTPHEGELARLLDVNSSEVRENRIQYAQKLNEMYSCHVLLKGHETILIDDKKNIFILKTGNPSLSKAGTGDVLLGIITSFLAQGLRPIDAMKCGVILHGFASKLYLKNGNDISSLRPTDLIDYLSPALKKLR